MERSAFAGNVAELTACNCICIMILRRLYETDIILSDQLVGIKRP